MVDLVDCKILEELIVEELEYDRDFFNSLLSKFRDSLNELTDFSIEQIRSNPTTLGQLAHKNKSSSASLGAAQLAMVLNKIEQAAKVNNQAEMVTLFTRAVDVKEKTLDELKRNAEIYFAKSR